MTTPIRTLSLSITLSVLGTPAGLNGYSGVLAQPAAVPLAPAAYRPLGEVGSRTELYFGTGKPGGTEVSAGELRHLMDRHLTPRFPDGLTLLPGSGQWRGADGDSKERSFVLDLPARRPARVEEHEAVCSLYKQAFSQASVLRVDSPQRVSF